MSLKRFFARLVGVEANIATPESAERLWEQPAFKVAVKECLDAIQEEWLATPDHEYERREQLHRETRALYRVCDQLQSIYQREQP